MADTYTSNLRLRKPEVGANNDLWAPLINDDMIDLIEAAIAGESVVDVTAGDVALTENSGAVDTSRPMFLRVIGTAGVTRTITATTQPKIYVIKNDSDASVIIEPASGAITVTILTGRRTMVYVDPGVGVFEVTTEGSFVSLDASAMAAITVDLDQATAGDTQTTLYWHRQGAMVYLLLEGFAISNSSGAVFTLSPNAGTWPIEIVPDRPLEFYLLMSDNSPTGLSEPVRLVMTADSQVAPWSLLKWDASSWGNNPRHLFYDAALVYTVVDF